MGSGRVAAAAAAVLAEVERVRGLVGDRPELLAHLYGSAAVRADDEWGRSAGLVVQADELRWAELEQLLRLASAGVDAGRHPGGLAGHAGCRHCAAAAALAGVRGRVPGQHQPGPAGPGEACSSPLAPGRRQGREP